MKKVILLAAVLAMSASAAFSQASFGLKGGLNLANLTNNDGEADMKASVYAGGFMEFRINDFFAISPELIYSRQGFHMEESGTKMNLRLNYLNLPILAKFYVTERLSVDVGPQVGCLLNTKLWMKSGGETATVDPNDYWELDENSLDVSFAIGLTYNFGNIFVQGRYNLGLTEYAKDADSKNSVIQFGVGYRF